MAKVGAQRAADLTGKSKSTIQRAMNNGKLSFELDNNGRRVVDVSELERAFGLNQSSNANPANTVEQELEKAHTLLESERLKMRIKVLEEQLDTVNSQVDDLKEQRDQWQKQASQVLITSQYSQKEAKDMREELKERDRRARERRQQKIEQQMKKLTPDNQNAQQETQQNAQQDKGDSSFNFSGLWKRVKGAA
ncbi:MAG: entry exclusion 1 domain-containing protein [Alphaproteobacteria bacterium]|nr:entry exclusion 1 domain-containing protein [Alphaproteobacteria bacterium]